MVVVVQVARHMSSRPVDRDLIADLVGSGGGGASESDIRVTPRTSRQSEPIRNEPMPGT